jgi:hypothetical protein
VRKSLLRRKDDRGRVVIYRPTGEVLRIVEVPEPVPPAVERGGGKQMGLRRQAPSNAPVD